MNPNTDDTPEARADYPDLESAYGCLCRELLGAMHKHNALRTEWFTDAGSYMAVIGTILPRWNSALSVDELAAIIREEFTSWVGDEWSRDDRPYRKIAREFITNQSRCGEPGEEKDSAGRRAQRAYATLYFGMLKVLHSVDPVDIPYMLNEYEPEVETIIPRLPGAVTPTDLQAIVKEEFDRWFWPGVVKDEGKYAHIAEAIWLLWQQYRDNE